MGVSEWWSSVITRAHEQQKSEAFVAWEDMQQVKAQLAEARELLDDLEWKPDMFAFITTHMHESEWIKRYEVLAGDNAATADSGTNEEK
jgi:hypothetical protein